MIPKFPKQTYEYLGYTSTALAARINNRCPTCAPADTTGVDGVFCTESPYAVAIPDVSEIRGRVSDGTTLWRVDTSDGHIYGHSIADGAQTDDIDLPTLLGRAYTTYNGVFDLVLGADGVTLFMAGHSGSTAGQCAMLKVNTATPSVTTFGVYLPATYSAAHCVAVNPYNDVWIQKGSTKIAAIDQTALTESFEITVNWGTAGWVYVSALDEVWVHKVTANTFEIYDASNGSFVASTSASGVNPFDLHYDATSGYLVVTGGTGMELWNTSTRTVVGDIDMSLSADSYRQGVYIPGINQIVAYKYIDTPYAEVYVFINAATMAEVETFVPSLLSPVPTSYSYTGITVIDRCNVLLELYDDNGAAQLYRTSRNG